MSFSALLNENIRKANLVKDETRDFVNANSWVIIPYIVSGVVNYTNRGYVANDINPNDAETFKRIWTGNDSCSVIWENSVKVISSNDSNNIKLKYQIGEYRLGLLTSNSSTNQTLADSGYSEYTSEQIKNYVTFQFDARSNVFSAYDMLKFYKIPKFSKEDIYRIVSIHKVFRTNTKEIDYYSVSFESVNQTFSNTGKAKQQNINMSSVGQGYLNPMVLNEDEFNSLPNKISLVEGVDYLLLANGEYLLADKNKVKHNPAKKAVIKLYGNAMPISISFVGRPVFYGDDNTRLRALRPIFGVTLEQPITPNLQRTSNATNNWYFGKFVPSMDAWADISQIIKDNVNSVVANQKFMGTFALNYPIIQQTNQLVNDSSGLNKKYIYSLYQYQNGSTEWKQWVPGIAAEYQTVRYVYGVDDRTVAFKYGGNDKSIVNILFDNYWIYKNDLQIPLNIQETKTYGSFIAAGGVLSTSGTMALMKPEKNWLRVFGLLGVSAALLSIGIGFTLSRQTNPPPSQPIYGLISAPFLDLSILQFKKTISGSFPNRIPITSFTNDTTDPVNSAVFDTPNSFNFQVQMELTDLFRNPNPIGDQSYNPAGLWSTTSIGQANKFENANGSIVTMNGKKMLMNGTQTLQPHRDIAGYIIEQVNIDSCFSGDISIEFLDAGDNVIYSGIYQSQAKWTGNIRDRWTSINTSILNNQNIITDKLFPYPSTIIDPTIDRWTATTLTSNPYYVSYNLAKTSAIAPVPSTNTSINLQVTSTNNYPTSTQQLFKDQNWVTWQSILNNYSQFRFKFFGLDNSTVVVSLNQFVTANDGSATLNLNLSNVSAVNSNTSITAKPFTITTSSSGRPGVKYGSPQQINISTVSNWYNVDITIKYVPTSTSFSVVFRNVRTSNNFNASSVGKYWVENWDTQEIAKVGLEFIQLVVK